MNFVKGFFQQRTPESMTRLLGFLFGAAAIAEAFTRHDVGMVVTLGTISAQFILQRGAKGESGPPKEVG